MYFVTNYVNRAKGARRTNIFARAATDTSLGIDGRKAE